MLVLGVLFAIIVLVGAPTAAGKALGLRGGLGKGAMVGLLSFGLMQIVGLVAGYLGPMGDILSLMGGVAAWYQVVRIIHGTDTARTLVFMFWHLFFQFLAASLLAMFFGMASVSWWWA
jgi:hypothetical protein